MRCKTKERDGVYEREDRPGWWISFIDAQGRRRRRKAKGASTLQQARTILTAELQNAERARIYGSVPPSCDAFSDLTRRYLAHQKPRLATYERTPGVVEGHLEKFFGSMKINEIRRADVQRYVTQRSGKVSAGTVARDLNILKRLFSL